MSHGKVSGVCCKIVEHPFDTIKVLMQVNGNVHLRVFLQRRKCIAIRLTVWRKPYVRTAFADYIELESVWGTSVGHPIPLSGKCCWKWTNVCVLWLFQATCGCYEWFFFVLSTIDPDRMTFSQMLLSSMGSGMTISFLLTPVELLKCRLQVRFKERGEDVDRAVL